VSRLANEIVAALSRAARDREDIWVLDGDLGDSYGLYDDNQRPRFDRFLQVGIAEQTLVAVAAGLAATGKLPWVFSFSAFLCYRACDQIRTCVAQPRLPVVFVGSHAGASTGMNGTSHASLADLGLLSALGGVELWAPADEADVHAAVASLLTSPRPAYLRTSRESVPHLPLAPGAIRTNGGAGRVGLLSTGLASHWANEVAAALATRGVILPWGHVARIDDTLLSEWLSMQPSMTDVVVLEDHCVVGGLADAVRRLAGARHRVHGLGWPRHWHGESGSIDELRRHYALDTPYIASFIDTLLG
jgi:transketolase